MALVTFHVNISEKLHVDRQLALAFAFITASTGHVKTEHTGRRVLGFCVGSFRKSFPNIIESFDIGHWITAARASNRRMVNQDNF